MGSPLVVPRKQALTCPTQAPGGIPQAQSAENTGIPRYSSSPPPHSPDSHFLSQELERGGWGRILTHDPPLSLPPFQSEGP